MPITKQDLIGFLRKYNRLLILRNSIKDEIEKLEREIRKYSIVPQKVDTRMSATLGKFFGGYIVWLIILTIAFSVIIFVVSFIMLIIGDGILPENFFTNMIRPISMWISEHIPLCEYAIFNLPITSIISAFFISAVLSIPCGLPDLKGEKKRSEEEFRVYYQQQEKIPELKQQVAILNSKLRDVDNHLHQMKNCGILHPKYEYYTTELIEFLETGRADTMKEAVNLLEHQWNIEDQREFEEQIREEKRREAKEQAEILLRIEESSARSAAATESLLRWEWLNQFF